jgi:hypothetical protein
MLIKIKRIKLKKYIQKKIHYIIKKSKDPIHKRILIISNKIIKK